MNIKTAKNILIDDRVYHRSIDDDLYADALAIAIDCLEDAIRNDKELGDE